MVKIRHINGDEKFVTKGAFECIFKPLGYELVTKKKNKDINDKKEIIDDKKEQDKVDEKPIDEKPIDEKPIDEKPIDEKPIDEKPIDEKPIDEKPIDKQNDENKDKRK